MRSRILVKLVRLCFRPRRRRQLSQEQYDAAFGIYRRVIGSREYPTWKQQNALKHALDIRKFEIELYWKRATYFWAFIAAAFAGYGLVQTIKDNQPARDDLSVVLSCLGVVFSLGWFFANKGSKQWQENWENHVDMLEDDVIGPLYKTVLHRPPPENQMQRFRLWIAGPGPYSVSKINQIISLFVTVLWITLLVKSLLPLSFTAPVSPLYLSLVVFTALACAFLFCLGKTSLGHHKHDAFERRSNLPSLEELRQKPVHSRNEKHH